MSKSRGKKLSEFLLGKGFYLVLALCIVGAGVAGYMAMSGPLAELPPTPELNLPPVDPTPNNPVIPPIEANTSQPSVPVVPSEEVVPPTDREVIVPEKQVIVPPSNFVMPVKGDVIKEFSGDNLVKNETLGDWRTHNGMDIAANKGDNVVAAGAGKVTDVRNDPLWGYTVVIEHDGGLTTVYAGLASKVKIGKNQQVKAGDVIGTVDYIPSESKQPDHLHFEAMRDGKYINPADLMK